MSLKTLLVIDVNARGSQIPGQGGQSAVRQTGLQTLLPWMVQRAAESTRIQQIVVVLSTSDARIVASRVTSRASVIASDGQDGLTRLMMAADAFDAEALVVVDFETPMIDPALIDMLVEAAEDDPPSDYISFRDKDDHASRKAGKYAEWCRVASLRQAMAKDSLTCHAATSILYTQPERFRLRFLKVSTPAERRNLKVRMDSPEDLLRVEDFMANLDGSTRNPDLKGPTVRAVD